jgi:hypothetical protein
MDGSSGGERQVDFNQAACKRGLQATFASSHTDPDPQLTVEKPKITVEFLIHRSLLDPKPTIVKRESRR